MTLEPCPFCNGPAELHADVDETYFVLCANKKCLVLPLTLPFRLKVDAVRAWNRRPASVDSDPLLAVGAKLVLVREDM